MAMAAELDKKAAAEAPAGDVTVDAPKGGALPASPAA
jgi:hypothetical protein